jgi:capsular exopolysaccharide synthesis family protein
MLLDDDAGSGGAVLKDLSVLSSNDNAKVEDEIEVLESRSFLKNIVEKLDLNVQYFVIGNVNESELYKNLPIDINFLVSDSIIQNTNAQFFIDILSESQFEYRVYEDDIPQKKTFGETIETSFGDMIITQVDSKIKQVIGSSLRVKITPTMVLAESLKGDIDIYASKESSKVLSIYMDATSVYKAIDVINTLIDEYSRSNIEQSKIQAKTTSDFINERVKAITSDLNSVEDSIVRYKSINQITDISSKGGMLSSASSSSEQELQTLRTNLSMLNYMLTTLNSGSFQSIPSNLGTGDAAIAGLAVRYNELLEKRKILAKSAGERNSVLLELDQSLLSIKNNLVVSINNSINNNNIQIRAIQNQLSKINSKISSVPGQESKLISIERRQNIKESLYLYLLEKREEAEISSSTTLPSAKIIDAAYSLGEKSSNANTIFFGALFLGLLLPFMVIYVTDLLDNKIHNKEDLENEIKNIPVLGELPRLAKHDSHLIQKNDRSILSEAFRIVRTNFEFVKRGRAVKAYNNVFFVTSTINGEGKSFVSLNTALTLAGGDKKVLLIGADLRNPQIYAAINNNNKKKQEHDKMGLSDYLADDSVLLGQTVHPHNINDITIDILLSGRIPPNPAELLMTDRVKTLFDTVSEQYDYVVVDTAPTMLVTDTLLISEYAGHTIYLTRAGYTEKPILHFAKDLFTQNKLKGMMLVVNDVKQSNFGYGAKYGYSSQDKKGFWQRIRKS